MIRVTLMDGNGSKHTAQFADSTTFLVVEALHAHLKTKTEALATVRDAYPTHQWREEDFGIPELKKLIELYEEVA